MEAPTMEPEIVRAARDIILVRRLPGSDRVRGRRRSGRPYRGDRVKSGRPARGVEVIELEGEAAEAT
jgi:hypothetical protein